MNSRNAFLIAGAAVLILIVAVLLLISGGDGDDGDSNNTDTTSDTGAPASVDTATAFEALFNGDAGPFKDLACGDADATLDSLATELAAFPRVEGAEYRFVCDTSDLAGDCQVVAIVGDVETASFMEFAVTEGEICNPIQWLP